MMGRIDAPRSSQVLAELAVFGLEDRIRKAATGKLVERDPRPFVGLLINWLHEPIAYQLGKKAGTDVLRVEGTTTIVERLYSVETLSSPMSQPAGPFARTNPTPPANLGALRAIQDQERNDVQEIERANYRIAQVNARTARLLTIVTGQDLGQSPEPWTAWWSGELGYSYQSPRRPLPSRSSPTTSRSSTSRRRRPWSRWSIIPASGRGRRS